MQKNYELMVLLHPDLEIDVETPISKIEGLVTAAGGRVTKRDNWGKKRLAYRIARQDFAIYVYFELQLPTSKVRELENALLITEEVLRHILVAHEENQRSDKAAGEKPRGKRTSATGETAEKDKEQAEVKTKEGAENG